VSGSRVGTGGRVLPFQLESSGLRGRLVELGGVANEIISRHAYPAPVAALLAECLALTAALSAVLKYDGIFSLQTKGDGPLSLLVADVTSDGDIRGYAEIEEGREGEIPETPVARPVEALLGEGRLAFTVDQGSHTNRYQGIVEMTGATLADCAQHYFRQSEQLPTRVTLAAGQDNAGIWRAAALMLQQIPHDDTDYDNRWDVSGIEDETAAEHWRRAGLLMDTLDRVEFLDRDLGGEAILYRLFNEDGVRVYEDRALQAGCRCSAQRVENVLRGMPPDELEPLKVDGRVIVTCQFCKFDYVYDEVDLAALRSPGSGTA
jgi:molecular chaperone Hsp33